MEEKRDPKETSELRKYEHALHDREENVHGKPKAVVKKRSDNLNA